MRTQAIVTSLTAILGGMVALLSIEWAALVIATVGLATGTLALYKALHAIAQLNEITDKQSSSVGELTDKVAVVEGKLTGEE